MSETKKKRPPLTTAQKKKMDRDLRDRNIREAEMRGRKDLPPESDQEVEVRRITQAEIRKRLRPLSRKKRSLYKEDLPYVIMRPLPDLEKRIMVDFELTDSIRNSYIHERDFEVEEKGDYKRESLKFGHVNACPREVYFDFFEPEMAREYTVKGLIIFEDGKAKHEIIQARLKKEGCLRDSEGWLRIDEVHANGRYDGLVPVEKKDGWLICDILEIKTKYSGACDYVNQRDYDQAQLYVLGSRESKKLKHLKIKIRGVRHFNRDRTIMTDDIHFGFYAKSDPERQVDIMTYLRFLWNDVVGKKKLVPHPYVKRSPYCETFCRYSQRCWQGFEDQVEEIDLDEITLPSMEIIQSAADKVTMNEAKIKGLKKEMADLKPILEAYFLHNPKEPILEITCDDDYQYGILPDFRKKLEWVNLKALMEEIGLENYFEISQPNDKRLNSFVHEHFIDMAIFEKYKKYHQQSLRIKIGKLRRKD